jgi:hypothetical protein
MNPAKQKRARAKSALRKLQVVGAYHATEILANAVGAVFWFVEQRRWRLADRVENESDGQ